MHVCSTVFLASLVVTNICDRALFCEPDARYCIEGMVSFVKAGFSNLVAIENDQGALTVYNETRTPFVQPKPGDSVRICGRTAIASNGTIRRNCTLIETIGHGPVPKPTPATVEQLADGKMDERYVRFRATLRDIFEDEIDPNIVYLVLQDGGDTILSYQLHTQESMSRLAAMVGSVLETTGVCSYFSGGFRTLCGRLVATNGPEDYHIVENAPSDPFDVPGIWDLMSLEPSRIARSGPRRATGTVIATWDGNRALVMNNRSQLVGVEFADGKVPPCDTMVDVVGLPASDLYRINLLRAKWRNALGNPLPHELPHDTSASSLLTDARGRFRYRADWHGRTIRIEGIVKAKASMPGTDRRFYVESDSCVIPVDVTSTPEAIDKIDVGYVVSLTGICIMSTSAWSPYTAFPQINGMTLAIRSADDVVVVAKPPWWTPSRLLTLLGSLLAVLAGFGVWNLQLRKSVRRREGALKREIFAHVNSDMKMRERNNLSIELHDSLSQGLTGVSMEIDTAACMMDDPAEARRHLDLAARSLKSCREELKTCIYDLKNDALGERTIDESIRRTLAPVVGNARLAVRFEVPRELVSDNIAHNVLRIIRELVTNAVNHGKATEIRIAGSVDAHFLHFSVTDNGCGFDPESCPGAQQGHFGRQGIRERVKRLGGTVETSSTPGNGAKVTVTIDLGIHDEEELGLWEKSES